MLHNWVSEFISSVSYLSAKNVCTKQLEYVVGRSVRFIRLQYYYLHILKLFSYIGYASIVNYGGVRIGGVSGIFKQRDFRKGHFEIPPYSQDTVRSVYHTRGLEVFRLKQVSG